jgi:hypothetical protein
MTVRSVYRCAICGSNKIDTKLKKEGYIEKSIEINTTYLKYVNYLSPNNNFGINNLRFTKIKNTYEFYINKLLKCTNIDETVIIYNEILDGKSDYESYLNSASNIKEKQFIEHIKVINSSIALLIGFNIYTGIKKFEHLIAIGDLVFFAPDLNSVYILENELYSLLTDMKNMKK